ncbi:MAG: HEPN domain-containing protein [bacterium]|nr:HEPN domain-containing protein [bacterium]
MRDDPKLEVERWLLKAQNDLRTTETMLSIDHPITDTACFHAHQCAEKCLKAFLTSIDVHVERTHDLTRLVEICSVNNAGFECLRSLAVELTDYAVASRYPDDWREIPMEEAMQALEAAKKVFEFVRGKIVFR